MISTIPNIVGYIGGRSGSVDAASFVGVNACQWDQPLFRKSIDGKPDVNSTILRIQIPQLLCLLNQKPFTDVIYLQTDDEVSKDADYLRFETEGRIPVLLNTWLEAEKPSESCLAIPPGSVRYPELSPSRKS